MTEEINSSREVKKITISGEIDALFILESDLLRSLHKWELLHPSYFNTSSYEIGKEECLLIVTIYEK